MAAVANKAMAAIATDTNDVHRRRLNICFVSVDHGCDGDGAGGTSDAGTITAMTTAMTSMTIVAATVVIVFTAMAPSPFLK